MELSVSAINFVVFNCRGREGTGTDLKTGKPENDGIFEEETIPAFLKQMRLKSVVIPERHIPSLLFPRVSIKAADFAVKIGWRSSENYL